MIVDRYYYHQLNKQEQAIYKAFYKGVMSHQDYSNSGAWRIQPGEF